MVSLERDLFCAIGERGHVDLFTERAAECLNGGVAAKFRDFADVFFFLIEVVHCFGDSAPADIFSEADSGFLLKTAAQMAS